MSNSVSRARAWALSGLLAYAPLAASQTMEIITGGARFVDLPGTTLPIQPAAMTTGPDGMMYLVANRRLLRFNPVQGTVTALPATSAGVSFELDNLGGAVAFDPAGVLHVSMYAQLYRVNLEAGTLTLLGPLPTSTDMVFAPNGTLYAVTVDSRVVSRSPSGLITTLAGNQSQGYSGDGGPSQNALLFNPQSIALAANGDIYIADSGNHRVRKISWGFISTVAGTGTSGYNGDGLLATQTNLTYPRSVVFDAAGNLLVGGSDYRIVRINSATHVVSTIAGTGQFGMTGDGGPALAARINSAGILTFDNAGNLYFSTSGNNFNYVRRIDATTGIITRALGNESLYYCGEGVPARFACFGEARGLDFDAAGNLLVTDVPNYRLRKISSATGLITTFAETPSETPFGVEHDASGNIYFTTWGNYRVHRIDATTGIRTIFAGTGNYSFSGDGGPATSASLAAPSDVAIDAAGNVYISDTANHRIRKVDVATRIITTYAGSFSSTGPVGDGGPAHLASLNNPTNIEFDPAGNLVISDGLHCRLRRINAVTRIITTIAGNGICASNNPGDGGLATATSIGTYPAFAFDHLGNIYLAWSGQIRRIDAVTGIISSPPVPPGGLSTPEGIRLTTPATMEFDSVGRLHVTDKYKPFVFRISGLLDSTPPSVLPNIVGTAGTGDWYRSNVDVSWTVTDAESAVTSTTDCSSGYVAEDTDGITFSCSATSAGGTTSRSVTIRRDTVAPSLSFGEASPAADASGWNSGDVSIPFTTNDDLSGVYVTSAGSPVTISGEGAELTREVVVTDFAGNIASFTTSAVNIDRSPPVVTSHVSGTLGNDGWYTSNVEVNWSVSESLSIVSSAEGCDLSSVTADTAGVTFTCTVTSPGGTGTRSVTVKRDATAPQLQFEAPSPAPGAGGWYPGDVTFPFTASDATAGLATSSSGSVVVSGEGTGLTAQITATDHAGNTASFTTPPVNITHAVPPVITAQLDGTLGNNGWYRGNAQVAWTIDAGTSAVTSSSGCEPGTVTADTAGTTFTCTATTAGGTSTQSVTIRRDATAPTLSFGTRTPAPNSRGWNNGNVSFPFTASDGLSGVAATSSPSPVVITGSGAGITGQVTVTDAAGNSATFSTAAVNIDRTVAVITPNISGTLGTNGWYRSNVQLTWTVDELPGSVEWTSGCGTYNINSDTTGVSYSCGVQSTGGYTSKNVSIKRDATAPVITITRPANGATYAVGENVTSSFGCTDARMQSCTGTLANGAALDTSTPGTKTFTVNALDLAGNTSTLVRTYTVQ